MKIINEINHAAVLLKAGKLVAFPTETVYGLGADAQNEEAIKRIFIAKERPLHHPLIVHLGLVASVRDWAIDISDEAYLLMRHFWPGPLTILLKKNPEVLEILTGGQQTIGVRMPSHPVALALLRAFGGGIAAPSANKFTRVSPTLAAHVYTELGSSVDLVLAGEPCEVGIESTIIDMSTTTPTILRPGMITPLQIESVLGQSIEKDTPSQTRAPGMHALHYAPRTQVEIIASSEMEVRLNEEIDEEEDLPAVCLVHSPITRPGKAPVDWVTMPNHAASYARALYRTLRQVDDQSYQRIFIEAVPNGAEWQAIQDRLRKASVSRLRNPE